MLIETVDKTDESIRLARSLGDRLNFMPDPLPKFDNPPVVETVLSAQFVRLAKYRTAHAGCFWQSALDDNWDTINETSKLEDQFERFGDERIWGPMLAGIRLSTILDTQRTQITRSDNTRMIQIQDSRFLYNWQKGEGANYPSHRIIRPEFDQLYGKFKKFAEEFDLGTIEENQWEITYISHLLKGEMWNSPGDWPTIFPWFSFPRTSLNPEFILARWAFMLPENRGRLHVNLNFGRVSINGPEAIIVDLTARGLASSNTGFSVSDGIEIGHEAIVRSFTAMTSDSAHKHWKRKS